MKKKIIKQIVLALMLIALLALVSCNWLNTPSSTTATTTNDTKLDNPTDNPSVDPPIHIHTEIIIPAVEATCAENGLTDGKKCSECGEILVSQEVVSAKGHTFGIWVDVKVPTNSENGLKERHCHNCDYKETETIDMLPDIIYYSDLFYGYDTSYLMSAYLENYYDDIDNITRDIFNDYVNSPNYIWTQIETSLGSLSAKEYFKLISDAYGGTNYNYQDAMDSANLMVAQNLIAGESGTVDAMGNVLKISSRWDKISKVFKKYNGLFDNNASDEEIVDECFDLLFESNIYERISSSQVESIKEQLLKELDALKDTTNAVSGVIGTIEVVKPIAVGLMLEDLRLEILDDIIENSGKNSTVYEGMCRLRNQLDSGFASYFVTTYFQEEVVDTIFKAIQKVATNSTAGSVYTFVTTCLEVASWIAFDVLFDIPDMDDILVQMVLNEYIDGFHFILSNKAESFKLQFDLDDVIEYESIFEGFVASCNAVLDASEKLTLSSNESKLAAVKNKNKDVSYGKYVDSVKSEIYAISPSERKVKKFNEWIINDASYFVPASETIESGKIYMFNGAFNGNLTIGKSLTITEGTTVTVNGNITLDGKIINNGTINAVDLTGSSYSSSKYTQSEENAVLNLTGNFTGMDSYFSNITDGTVIFSGTNQQTVNRLKAYNIEVLNPEGIKYLSDISVYGAYDLHGNSLDNGEFLTYLYNADIAPGSNYGDLYIIADEKTYSYDIMCDSISISSYSSSNGSVASYIYIDNNAEITILEKLTVGGKLRIDENARVAIGDEVVVSSSGVLTITEGTTVTVNGNITLDGKIINNGTINAVDLTGSSYSSSKYTQSEENAVLNLTGNFTGMDSYFSNITDGTVIFSGTTQQTASRLVAPTIIIENESVDGVCFDTSINVSKLFNHNGNNFTLYNNGNGSTFVDYDGDGVLDNVDPNPIDPNK